MDYITTLYPLGAGDPGLPLACTPTAYVLAAFVRHSIKADGLDGGTYSIDLSVPGSAEWAVAYEARVEADLVDLPTLVDGVRVRFAGLGAAAVPVIVLNSFVGG